MPTLPKLRCPNCGKAMGPVTANVVPPANKYEDCLRRCPKCRIGATNAKNFAKVKFIHADPIKTAPQPAAPAKAAEPKEPAPQEAAPEANPPEDAAPPKP